MKLRYSSDKLANTMCPQCAHIFHVRPPESFMQALGDVMQVHDQRYDELLADMRELLKITDTRIPLGEKYAETAIRLEGCIDRLREKWGEK